MSKDTQNLQAALDRFTGTEAYHRFNPLMPNVLLTDGAKFLAERAKAWWLMDAIASHLPSVPAEEGFVVVSLDVEDNKAVLTLADDKPAEAVYAKQKIGFTDFPLPQVTLYAGREGAYWVVLLPSEY